MEIFVFILIVIACILCYKLSKDYNERMEDKYYQACINWWWSVATAVLAAAAILTIGETTFWLFLFLALGVAGLSAWFTYKKMISWGATSKEAGLGSAAQVASAVGIAALILFVILLLFGGSGKKKRKRR